jgi:TRAP-type C4-dicarboxylate transport system substrate-binding protein
MSRAIGRVVPALTFALLAGALTGCGASGSADKAGGSGAPTVLRLANSNGLQHADVPAVRYFAAQVAKLSGGKLRIHVVYGAAGDEAGAEARIARMVQAGKFDLGWIGARAWDELGVKSFQALQAPFLITDYTLLDRVADSPLAGKMLAGLNGDGLVGLALVPDLLRHPVGLRRPLVSPADFAGARMRFPPSKATAALLTALGAVPVEVSDGAPPTGSGDGRLDGEELSFPKAFSGTIVTGNVTFFGKVITLFAGRRVYDRLSERQRTVLRKAAGNTLRQVRGHPPSESSLARAFCENYGRIVLASRRDLAALVRAARPVLAQLEADPQTKTYIKEIRKLKATVRADPPLVVPKGCSHSQRAGPAASGKPRSPSIVNGTYRWLLTEAAARAFGPPMTGPDNVYPVVSTAILRDGKWTFTAGDTDQGTYTVARNRIRFVWPRIGSVLTFTFTQDRDGTLHLTPVPPMDRGDQFVWASQRWRRIGPPIQTVP